MRRTNARAIRCLQSSLRPGIPANSVSMIGESKVRCDATSTASWARRRKNRGDGLEPATARPSCLSPSGCVPASPMADGEEPGCRAGQLKASSRLRYDR